MKRDIQCAATSFLRVEKGCKETPGALPLVPQVIGRFSPHENRRQPYLLHSAHIIRAAAPEAGLLHFFSPAPNRSPGASGPLVVWTSVQEISYPPIFTKRKSANFLGVRGNPGGVFASFCGYELKLGQKEVARRPNPFNKL